MGLFSDEKRIVVGTQVSRVIPDNLLPDSIKTGLTNALFSGDEIPSSIMESLISSIGVKAEQMYEYGRTKYTHGLPSGAVHSAIDGQDEVTAVLTAAEGAPILLEYSYFRPRNLLHIGWYKLMTTKGYNAETNIMSGVSVPGGYTVYLNDMMVVVPSGSLSSYRPGALDLWGVPATAGKTPSRLEMLGRKMTPVISDPGATYAHIRVQYIWEGAYLPFEGMNEILTGTFEITVDEYVTQADYFHVKYKVNGVTKYQIYKAGSGTYPTLDNLFNQPAAPTGTFFPFAYFRYNGVSEISNKTTDVYKTSKKLVKYMGMDYDEVASAIDENPDIANVHQAMAILAVPATTTNPLEQRYLFSFFNNLFYSVGNQYTTPNIAHNAIISGNAPPDFTKSALIIQDKRFKMALSNDGVFKKRVSGSIGPVGTHTSSFSSVQVEEEYATGWANEFIIAIRSVDVPVHIYRRQITKTLYDEISVHDLKVQYHVFGEYFVTASGTENTLLIPIDRAITGAYSISDREAIYSRSLHFVFNSMQVITLAWYQRAWFSGLLFAIGLIVTLISFGSASGPMATLMKGVTAASLKIAAIALFKKLLFAFVVSYALTLFVKAVGGEVAIIIAIAAMAWAGYDAMSSGSIQGAPWAQRLLQLSSGLTKAVSTNLQGMMKDLLEEYQSFNQFKDEATKQLEAANKLLENNNWLNPFVIFGEKPDDYYNRTVHSGNIGIVGISAISSYVDNALTLPKMDQSIGEA